MRGFVFVISEGEMACDAHRGAERVARLTLAVALAVARGGDAEVLLLLLQPWLRAMARCRRLFRFTCFAGSCVKHKARFSSASRLHWARPMHAMRRYPSQRLAAGLVRAPHLPGNLTIHGQQSTPHKLTTTATHHPPQPWASHSRLCCRMRSSPAYADRPHWPPYTVLTPPAVLRSQRRLGRKAQGDTERRQEGQARH